MPVIIRGIEICSVDSNGDIEIDYGQTLYSDKINFLQPRIIYQGIKGEETIILYFKLYTPSGVILTNTTSPSGFTSVEKLNVTYGENIVVMSKWRWKDFNWADYWKKGEYHFEIWYKDVCLKTKTFTIY